MPPLLRVTNGLRGGPADHMANRGNRAGCGWLRAGTGRTEGARGAVGSYVIQARRGWSRVTWLGRRCVRRAGSRSNIRWRSVVKCKHRRQANTGKESNFCKRQKAGAGSWGAQLRRQCRHVGTAKAQNARPQSRGRATKGF
eukprot:scaffold33140_cov101-Isochrysis_galbana.AAC.1